METFTTDKGTVWIWYKKTPYKQTIIRKTDWDSPVINATAFKEINCKPEELLPALNQWGW